MTETETDVLVIGAGAGGLTAAITARLHKLEVQVIEKEPVFGGATAWSGGVAWIPGNSHAKRAGVADSLELARTYIQHEAGNFYDPERVAAYLVNGPAMVDLLERKTEVKFELANEADYHPATPGALPYGRALRPLDFDGRKLGPDLARLRQQARERVLFMGMQVGMAHLTHFLNVTRSFTSFRFVTGRILGHLRDVAIHGRSVQTAMGNALAGRLGKSALDLGIPIAVSTPALELLVEQGVVVGARIQREGHTVRIRVRRGVVLACGGFPHDYVRRQQVFPHHPTREQHLSNAPPSTTGDGIRLAEAAGAAFQAEVANLAAWYPTSRARYPDGTEGNNAHTIDRGKPGVIAVMRSGKRFASEAQNYHDFGQALLRAHDNAADITAFFICDHRALRRYGLGVVRPWPLPYRPFIRTGYLKQGRTAEALAEQAGIDPQGLARTVEIYNQHARSGCDPEFGKGGDVYERGQGDPAQRPNPCVAPLEALPLYAVEFRPGDLATFGGLRTDRYARVLNRDGVVLRGLYAVGNDQANVFGGAYPGGGATLGPAMTFGYIAGRHLAGIEAEC